MVARPRARGRLDVDEPGPRANLAEFLSPDEAFMGDAQALLEAYGRTFCGACGAGPHEAARRCPACLALLAKVLSELHGDEPGKIAKIARLAHEGKL